MGGNMIETVMGTRYVNGKYYPMWEQFREVSDEYKGGVLTDFGDSIDKAIGLYDMSTEIVKIDLRENGEDSAFFEVAGKDFTCGFDVKVGSISPYGPGMGITFTGYGGHEWHIQKPRRQ
jgi:hypothetical protein